MSAVDALDSIRLEYAAVETLLTEARLQLDSTDYECPDEPHFGTLSFYRYQDELRLIRHNYSQGDHFGVSENYYLKDGKLFFAYREENYWAFDTELPHYNEDPLHPATKDEVTESRYYFSLQNEQPLRCLQKKYVIRHGLNQQVDPASIPNDTLNFQEASMVTKEFLRLRDAGTAAELAKTLCP